MERFSDEPDGPRDSGESFSCLLEDAEQDRLFVVEDVKSRGTVFCNDAGGNCPLSLNMQNGKVVIVGNCLKGLDIN